MTTQNYYDLLGVEKSASFDEIKRAFRVKAKECHPDYHPGDTTAEARFKEINEAYEVLKDDQKRAAYDRYGHQAYTSGMGGAGGGASGFGGFDFSGTGFESIFEEMFSGFTGRSRSGGETRVNRGSDLRYDLEITLQEAYDGLKKSIDVETYVACDDCGGKGGKSLEQCDTCGGYGHIRQRQGFFVVDTECPTCNGTGKKVKDPCSKCKGSGRIRKKRTLEVNIPKGIDSGIRMRLSGEGHVGQNGGTAGDLYVFLTVKQHEIFEREGANLYCEIPIPMTTAALGGTIDVPTMSGKTEKLEVKAGTQSGHQVKLKGKGMPVLKSSSFGDLYVSLKVETPKHLTQKQKELLREFAKESKDETQEACTDFLSQIKKLWDNI
ncbi:MAG: molecular chaperone DnaJ [Alphaproteobacteria bacterium]|nr:molecular chaperone DnaJ [Alphaproteobacteria bacterium]